MIAFRSFPKILLSLILLGVSCQSKPEIIRGKDGELTIKGIIQRQDMSEYDQGGHFFCCRRVEDTRNIRSEEKNVRDFIWQHWTEKKRGYIRLSYMGADSSWTTHYFIEPNENGEWNVVWKYLYQHSLLEHNLPSKEGFGIVEKVESSQRKGDWELDFKPKYGGDINNIPIF
jgi:hypothetical protein